MTIRDIAKACGVSTATVDRVLNGRGKVRPETEAKVLQALEKAGYTKNLAARALAIRKASPVVGVVISSEGNPFFGEVLAGIHRAEGELAEYGMQVRLCTMRGYDPQQQLSLIEELEPDLSALVLNPVDDPLIVDKIAHLAEAGIPTVTVNTDLVPSKRCCYVGSDYIKGGETAAGLMHMVTQGKGRLGILTGVETLQGHRRRLRGFETHLAAICPGMKIAARSSAQDDDRHAYAATRAMLRADPMIDTLLLIAAGLEGVCEAVKALGLTKRIRLFAFDNIPATRPMMESGLLKAVVCQQPFQQGHQSVRAAMDIILSGGSQVENQIMENQICILENLA